MGKVGKKKKKEKNEKKRSILLLVLLFLFAVVGTVTYAWFSSDTKLTIDTMEIRIETTTGIQVSANAVNWTNNITKTDLINAHTLYPDATNQLPLTLAGCSTDGSVNPTGLNMFYGSTRQYRSEGFFLTATKQTEINCVGDEECVGKHYVAFDIFILLTEPADLVVTDQSYVINKLDKTENDDESGDEEEEEESKGAPGGENGARVGFVNLGTTTDTANSVRAQYLANATESAIWEPNYDVHTEHGILNAEKVYGITTNATGASRLIYKGINSEITGKGVALSDTDSDPHFTTVNPKVATPKVFTGDQDLMYLPAGITKLRIYFWIEGQDVDCENEVGGGELEFKLEIAIK